MLPRAVAREIATINEIRCRVRTSGAAPPAPESVCSVLTVTRRFCLFNAHSLSSSSATDATGEDAGLQHLHRDVGRAVLIVEFAALLGPLSMREQLDKAARCKHDLRTIWSRCYSQASELPLGSTNIRSRQNALSSRGAVKRHWKRVG